jgi:hypothetical protein
VRKVVSTAAIAALVVLTSSIFTAAPQRGGRGGPGGPALTGKQAAPFDPTGYWVAVISEDWKLRMITPGKGVYDALTLNPAGRKVADSWDPAADEKSGDLCKGYGAPALMRLPTRLHITWENDNTLRIDTDLGTQTRRFYFGTAVPPAGEPSLQGQSVAQWELGAGRGGQPQTGNLKVATNNLRAGYIRKNGAPYSDKTTMTEYFDLHKLPNGDQILSITTLVSDPVYFNRTLTNTSDFKKLPSEKGWNPTPCSAR